METTLTWRVLEMLEQLGWERPDDIASLDADELVKALEEVGLRVQYHYSTGTATKTHVWAEIWKGGDYLTGPSGHNTLQAVLERAILKMGEKK